MGGWIGCLMDFTDKTINLREKNCRKWSKKPIVKIYNLTQVETAVVGNYVIIKITQCENQYKN